MDKKASFWISHNELVQEDKIGVSSSFLFSLLRILVLVAFGIYERRHQLHDFIVLLQDLAL